LAWNFGCDHDSAEPTKCVCAVALAIIGMRHNEIVEADDLARQDEATGSNSYRGSIVKMLDGLAA
jgi:hypothetical protein